MWRGKLQQWEHGCCNQTCMIPSVRHFFFLLYLFFRKSIHGLGYDMFSCDGDERGVPAGCGPHLSSIFFSSLCRFDSLPAFMLHEPVTEFLTERVEMGDRVKQDEYRRSLTVANYVLAPLW